MQQINQQNFKEEVVNFKGIVLADFYADWCGPCQILSPLLEELSKKLDQETGLKFVKINVDQEQSLAEQFGIMSIPTVIIFKNGRVVNQQVGVAQETDYQKLISQAK